MKHYLYLIVLVASLKKVSEQKLVKVSSGSSISTSCKNGSCRTCIDGECYPRGFSKIHTFGDKCQAVACENNCSDIVVFKDKCPICRCFNGSGSRQPCNNNSDCASEEAVCLHNLCMYKNVSSDLPKACQYDFDCDSNHTCSERQCTDGADVPHAKGISCTFPYQCPSGFGDCRKMTCYKSKGQQSHVHGLTCIHRNQCPSGYTCKTGKMTCVKSDDGIEHLPGVSCVLDTDCKHDDYTCDTGSMTCIKESSEYY